MYIDDLNVGDYCKFARSDLNYLSFSTFPHRTQKEAWLRLHLPPVVICKCTKVDRRERYALFKFMNEGPLNGLTVEVDNLGIGYNIYKIFMTAVADSREYFYIGEFCWDKMHFCTKREAISKCLCTHPMVACTITMKV